MGPRPRDHRVGRGGSAVQPLPEERDRQRPRADRRGVIAGQNRTGGIIYIEPACAPAPTASTSKVASTRCAASTRTTCSRRTSPTTRLEDPAARTGTALQGADFFCGGARARLLLRRLGSPRAAARRPDRTDKLVQPVCRVRSRSEPPLGGRRSAGRYGRQPSMRACPHEGPCAGDGASGIMGSPR